MTQVLFDPESVGLTTQPGDRVIVWAPVVRRGGDGHLVTTAPATILVHPSPVTADLEPGPMVVKIVCRGWSDLSDKRVTVPEVGPVSLWDLLKEADS